jgi:phosphomannomutase/phosphoglucomutase
LMLFARDILTRTPGATVIYDVKCSRLVGQVIKDSGGQPLMWKTGHSLIKAKLRETGAVLAGEMSGHVFFKERWYGFDDGLYAAVRLLEIISDVDDASAVLNALPNCLNTPELHLPMAEGKNFKLIERLQTEVGFPESLSISTIDGVRVEYADGFGLVRASNTTPVLVMRFEADSKQALERIQQTFKAAILQINPELVFPF